MVMHLKIPKTDKTTKKVIPVEAKKNYMHHAVLAN